MCTTPSVHDKVAFVSDDGPNVQPSLEFDMRLNAKPKLHQ